MATSVALLSGIAAPPEGPVPAARSPCESPLAACSAAAKAPHVWYRSSGALAIALVMTWSITGGRSGRRLVSAGGGAEIWAHKTARP
jgi:hypothetical protein